MNVNGKHYRTIWVSPKNKKIIQIIDQRALPHKFKIENLKNSDEVARAIKEMHVRGAGLIGATAGYGMYLASLESPEKEFDSYIQKAGIKLKSTRPTAVNLEWAVNRQLKEIEKVNYKDKIKISFETAEKIANEDADSCKKIGEYGFEIIKKLNERKSGGAVNILTHCNAGWLAFVDYGSALSPIYEAFQKKIPVHIWVDITGPWNQGAKLTCWELAQQGIPHTLISDNTGGYLMEKGLVDMVIVGADRVTTRGDVVNKIGTYLKALAAHDTGVPFYVAFPSSTLDWKIRSWKDIPIEERGSEEVKYATGKAKSGSIKKVLLAPKETKAVNYGFDITPARLVKRLITEEGICKANEIDILSFFGENKYV
jgi:methylthioribose-1-phosphate isomerase